MANQRPLRICVVAPVYCHPDWRGGGVARSSADTARALAERGNRVSVLSPLVDGDQRFPLPERKQYVDGLLTLHYDEKAKSTRFGTSRGTINTTLPPLLANSDVVHIHSFLSPWTDAAATICRKAGVPYVIQDRGKLTPSILTHRQFAKTIYLCLRGRSLLRDAACVITLAESIADSIARWDNRIRCKTCPNGLDPEEFDRPATTAPIPEPYVLFLGWLDPRKNPRLLVQAFAAIAAETQPWKLALVGPDSYGQARALHSLINESGMQDRIILPGPAHGDGKVAWLKHAGIFALPSEGEGLSVAMIEALACGLPCLLSPGCNYPEIETAGAGKVLELRKDAWAAAMRQYILSEEQRAAAGLAARKQFESNHTLKAIAERLEAIMNWAVGQGMRAERSVYTATAR